MNNLDLMKQRLNYQGGNQGQRMIKDKYKTFQKSLLYSYQAADVEKVGDTTSWKALINPDKTKFDYDNKILSIDYASGYKVGDVFKWIGTNTYWLIYLQALDEDAYFRSEIRRCKHQIKWVDDSMLKSTWAYVKGPIETTINFIQKNNISLDVPNWSIELYVANNEDTKKLFKRYNRFMLNGITWEVQVVDGISAEGILQVNAKEYFTNPTLDNKEQDLVDAFKVVPVVPQTPTQDSIKGEIFIKPLIKYRYTGKDVVKWFIKENNRPIKFSTTNNKDEIEIEWANSLSGQFTLCFEDIAGNTYERVIVVESLF